MGDSPTFNLCSVSYSVFVTVYATTRRRIGRTVLGRCHTCNFIAQLCRATLSRDKVAVCNCACCTLRQIA